MGIVSACIYYNQCFGEGEIQTSQIVIATLLAIGCIALFIMASDKSYNASVDHIKRLDGAGNWTAQKFCDALADLDTPLGKPWMAELTVFTRPCVVWGPNANGEYIYAYKTKFTGSMYIAYSEDPGFLRAKPEDAWRLSGENNTLPADDYRELVCYKLDLATMLDDLRDRFLLAMRGKPLPPMPDYKQGALYRFDEDFRWTGQDFSLCTMDGDPLYKVTGTMPLKTFRIFDARDDLELMRLTKRIFHLLPHYDFYQGGEKLGTFRKCWTLIHDRYVLRARQGTLELQNVNATFGENFTVHRNGEIIGTVAEKLNLSIENIVFDNFVIHVRDNRDTLLLTALAVMVARGQARKRNAAVHDTEED